MAARHVLVARSTCGIPDEGLLRGTALLRRLRQDATVAAPPTVMQGHCVALQWITGFDGALT